MKYHVQVLTARTGDLRPSVLIFFENERYLINCPEGTQRFCFQHKVRMSKLAATFFTSLEWRILGGFPGMYLTLFDFGLPKLNVIGPKGTGMLLDAMKMFAYRSEATMEIHEASMESSEEQICYQDKNISVLPLFISRNKGEGVNGNTDDRGTIRLGPTVGYIFRGPSVPGKFDVQRAKALNVPPAVRSKLVAGEEVLVDGRVIKPEDCVFPRKPGSLIVYLDLPSMDHVRSFIKEHSARLTEMKPSVIFYDIEQIYFDSEDFIKYIQNSHPATEHVLLGDFSSKHVVFTSATINQHKLHHIDPMIYPLLHHDERMPQMQCDNPKVLIGKCLLKFDVEPKFGLCLHNVIPSFTNPKFSFHSLEEDSFPSMYDTLSHQDDLTVSFLGTGSAIPLSGIYFSVDRRGGFIMDFGEGSMGQLFRLFGHDQSRLDDIILNIKCIFISHIHADHHLGLISLLKEQHRSCDITKYRKYMHNWTTQVECMASILLQGRIYLIPIDYFGPFKFVECSEIIYENSTSNSDGMVSHLLKQKYQRLESNCGQHFDYFENLLGFSNVSSVLMEHCEHAYGFVLEHKSGWKISYSGDSRPCSRFAEAGLNSDLLIHEATFEDGLQEDAVSKRHSTFSEAVDIATKMKAKSVILTHFSQRYPKIPVINDTNLAVGIAFDFLTIKLSDAHKLKSHLPHLTEIFADEEKEDEL